MGVFMGIDGLKKVNQFNTLINAVLCIGSLILLKFELNPMKLCLCYIASDIFLSIIDFAACKVVFKKAIKNEKTEALKSIIEEYYMKYDGSNEVKNAYYKLKEEAKKYEKIKSEELKKQLEEEEKRRVEEYNNTVKKIKGLEPILNITDEFIEFCSVKISNEYKIRGLKKIYKEFLRLKDNLEKKTEKCFIVNFSFQTYTKELMNLISIYDEIPKTKREEYDVKYNEMISEFLIYMKNLNDKIEAFSVTDAKIGLDTLIEVLKDVNKEKGA